MRPIKSEKNLGLGVPYSNQGHRLKTMSFSILSR